MKALVLFSGGVDSSTCLAVAVEKYGSEAVREADKNIPIMVHLDNGGKIELYEEWFDNFVKRGGDFDVIGLSYYPFWHGSLEGLKANLENCAKRYGKDLIIAEVSMGHTMESYAEYEQLSEDERKGAATKPELAEKVPFPMTEQGQADFIQAVMEIVKNVPGGKGIFWWEPAWIPVPGSSWALKPGWEYVREKGPVGNEWANQALFDYEGNALGDDIVTNGGRVLGVVAKGDNLKVARANAYEATKLVDFANKYMRNDIGKAIDEA